MCVDVIENFFKTISLSLSIYISTNVNKEGNSIERRKKQTSLPLSLSLCLYILPNVRAVMI